MEADIQQFLDDKKQILIFSDMAGTGRTFNASYEFANQRKRAHYGVAELCARYGISRKTGYEWIARFEEGGYPALADLTRRPRSCPHRPPTATEEAILTVRRRHPFWGAKKLLKLCRRRNPEQTWPAGMSHWMLKL